MVFSESGNLWNKTSLSLMLSVKFEICPGNSASTMFNFSCRFKLFYVLV